MDVGQRIKVPPPGSLSVSELVDATVASVGRHRNIRDPADGSTRPHQWIEVEYDDGQREKFDLYFLEPLQR